MQIGVSFPTTEIGNNPEHIRRFAEGAEALGYDYLTCIDHVIQGRNAVADDWRAYYTIDNAFHETLVLFGFLAAATQKIGLTSAILILPQRPTVLVAKQLAEIDILSGGRLRAGVGIGWNALEFGALDQTFNNRARRIEEQIALLRRLWSENLVTFEGEWHHIDDAGLNPLPVQQPIPIWIGAFEAPAIRRAGRISDGLLVNPRVKPGPDADAMLRHFRASAEEAEREVTTLGLEATMFTQKRGGNAIREELEQWRERGASHVTLRTMTAGLTDVEGHLDALEEARRALD